MYVTHACVIGLSRVKEVLTCRRIYHGYDFGMTGVYHTLLEFIRYTPSWKENKYNIHTKILHLFLLNLKLSSMIISSKLSKLSKFISVFTS